VPDFGVLYDSVPIYAARQDVQFYVEEAAAARGPVLELGCGTGRILLATARAGHTIMGLDDSAHMLERCRSKIAGETEDVRDRITLTRGDLRDFDLAERFALITAPFRVVQHLTSVDDQLRFLAAVLRHLAPDGRLVFDVFNPRFSALVSADGVEREDTPEQRLSDGRTFRRSARVARVRWIDQVSEVELIYYVADGTRTEQRYVQAFDMRWFLRSELEHLLARAGFRLRAIYGDFDRSLLADGCPELIVTAVRR
ncbi:MAG: class I SAM-dependent methyltransferase, partial [Gemmatimonadaceae bacterium]